MVVSEKSIYLYLCTYVYVLHLACISITLHIFLFIAYMYYGIFHSGLVFYVTPQAKEATTCFNFLHNLVFLMEYISLLHCFMFPYTTKEKTTVDNHIIKCWCELYDFFVHYSITDYSQLWRCQVYLAESKNITEKFKSKARLTRKHLYILKYFSLSEYKNLMHSQNVYLQFQAAKCCTLTQCTLD